MPGDHASTFGGNPVACAAARAVVDVLDEELLADVRAKGGTGFAAARFAEARGRGLLLAVDLDRPAAGRRRGARKGSTRLHRR